MVIVPLPSDPFICVQVIFPFGPLLADAGTANEHHDPRGAQSATAATDIPVLRNRCIHSPFSAPRFARRSETDMIVRE